MVNVTGLASGYRHHHNTRRVCGFLWGLSYLPVHLIQEAYRYVVAENNEPQFRQLFEYFETTWLNGRFEPRFWSVYRQAIRTNNSLEGNGYSISQFV